MFSHGSGSSGRATLPSDWMPNQYSSRGPSPQNSAADNDLGVMSPSLIALQGSSRSGDMAVPILHSSNEDSSHSQSLRHMPPFADERRDADANHLGRDGNEEPVAPGDARQNPPRERAYRHPLPQPRAFDGKGERNIKQFFSVYEKYCKSMWGDNTQDWVSGLELLLKGWALVLYNNLVNQGKSYNDIKTALQHAFPGVVDPFRTRNLMKLLTLKREQGEPLPVFYMRVDTLIRETYPNLEEVSAGIQCRDTFLMKLDPHIASKIASYCASRNCFEPRTVQEAAVMVGSEDFFST